ncbi:MAG: family 20 glycosylhydrolase [Candidatus Elarobacter sp.]
MLLGGCTQARAFTASSARAAIPLVSVVPQPRSMYLAPGRYAWPPHVRVRVSDAPAAIVTQQLRAYLHENGVAAAVVAPGANADVALAISGRGDPRLGDEGYTLAVGVEGVTLHAHTQHGLFYALQTLEQLSVRTPSGFVTQAVTVADWPAYRWRGVQLDVARHFFAVPVIERAIDVAAHYKLNMLQWHLTDDQAWRLQSDRYPALGAGGAHYTPADVRSVVAYAARRYVTVVPEIDLPAHAAAALRAYPRLACGSSTLCTTGTGLAFARNVLGDAADAFPSLYLHGGGDEVPPPALARQPEFTRAIERTVEARGRRFVGWDEILGPGLSPRAVVMVWTARDRAAQAARRGNDVVVASGPLYFDAAQGDAAQEPRASAHMSTLEEVYDDPILPPGLSARESAHVLGAQANLWTERIATPQHLFYMLLPRALALSEIAWTPPQRKSWDSFVGRLPAQLAWLDAHRYPFRIPNAAFALSGAPTRFAAVRGHVQAVEALTTAPALMVTLSVPLDGAIIRYTVGGATPSRSSPAYRGPLNVRVGSTPVVLRARTSFRGRTGAITECRITRIAPAALRARRGLSATWSALVSP